MDDVVGKLERLEAEATPGLWRVCGRTHIEIEPEEDGRSSAGITHRSERGFYMGADAALIAEARNALPALLEVARAARKVKAALDGQLGAHEQTPADEMPRYDDGVIAMLRTLSSILGDGLAGLDTLGGDDAGG